MAERRFPPRGLSMNKPPASLSAITAGSSLRMSIRGRAGAQIGGEVNDARRGATVRREYRRTIQLLRG